MIFNVRLRQSRVYDTAVEADTADQAVLLAMKLSKHDPANWADEGSQIPLSVDPEPDMIIAGYNGDQLEELLAEAIAAQYFSGDDGDEDDLDTILI